MVDLGSTDQIAEKLDMQFGPMFKQVSGTIDSMIHVKLTPEFKEIFSTDTQIQHLKAQAVKSLGIEDADADKLKID